MRQSMALLLALAARPARALIPRLHRVPRAAVARSMSDAPVNLVVDPETGEEMSKSALKKLQKQRKIDAKKAAKKQKAAEAAPAPVEDKGPPLVAAATALFHRGARRRRAAVRRHGRLPVPGRLDGNTVAHQSAASGRECVGALSSG